MKKYVVKSNIEEKINSIISNIDFHNIESKDQLEKTIRYRLMDNIVYELIDDVVEHITKGEILVDFDVTAVDGSGEKLEVELKGIVLNTSCLFNPYKFGDDAWDAIMIRLQRAYPNRDFKSKDAYLDEYIDKNIRFK